MKNRRLGVSALLLNCRLLLLGSSLSICSAYPFGGGDDESILKICGIGFENQGDRFCALGIGFEGGWESVLGVGNRF